MGHIHSMLCDDANIPAPPPPAHAVLRNTNLRNYQNTIHQTSPNIAKHHFHAAVMEVAAALTTARSRCLVEITRQALPRERQLLFQRITAQDQVSKSAPERVRASALCAAYNYSLIVLHVQ